MIHGVASSWLPSRSFLHPKNLSGCLDTTAAVSPLQLHIAAQPPSQHCASQLISVDPAARYHLEAASSRPTCRGGFSEILKQGRRGSS